MLIVEGNIVYFFQYSIPLLLLMVPFATISVTSIVFQCHITSYKMFEFFLENLPIQVHVGLSVKPVTCEVCVEFMNTFTVLSFS
jgi:hypothetical protein